MTPTERLIRHKVLLVDDDDAVRAMMTVTLEHKGFEVVAAANVTQALRLIATETFDALITDLHMPNAGDGFTVISAMRHSQPDALTLLVSGSVMYRPPWRQSCWNRTKSSFLKI